MKRVILILSVFWLCGQLFANTPKIVTLHELMDQSEHVMCGAVLSTAAIDTAQERECLEKYWVGCKPILYKAKIRIMREFKGYVKNDVISFDYYYGSGCFCNGFNPKDTIIVFLNRTEFGYLMSNHCVFGDKTLTPEGINEYMSRINDYPIPMLFHEKQAYKRVITEWYIKCAEGYYTSWEGMYKINDVNEPITLSLEQINRLRAALLKFKSFELRHIELLRYVAQYDNSPELKRFIYKNLKRLNKYDYYITAYDLMSAYTKTDTNPLLAQILDQYTKSKYSQNSEYGFALVTAFIQVIDKK